MRDDEARAFGQVFYGTPHIFKDLPIGGKFIFPTNGKQEVCTKTSNNGWYVMEDGRKFQTGGNTAVKPVSE